MENNKRRNAVDGTPSPQATALNSPTLGPVEARIRAYSMVPPLSESLLNLYGVTTEAEPHQPRGMREILAEIDAMHPAIPEEPVEFERLPRNIGMPDVRDFGR
jgi:hypothetical protein